MNAIAVAVPPWKVFTGDPSDSATLTDQLSNATSHLKDSTCIGGKFYGKVSAFTLAHAGSAGVIEKMLLVIIASR